MQKGPQTDKDGYDPNKIYVSEHGRIHPDITDLCEGGHQKPKLAEVFARPTGPSKQETHANVVVDLDLDFPRKDNLEHVSMSLMSLCLRLAFKAST